MTVEQVKRCRELFGRDDLFVYLSAGDCIDGSRLGTVLVWDDNHALFYYVSYNQLHLSADTGNNVDVRVSSYDMIEYLSDVRTIPATKKFLDKLVSDGLLNSDRVEKVTNELTAITNPDVRC